MLLLEFGDFAASQTIAAFVVGVAGVAFDPFPSDAMLRDHFVQAFPQIHILDRLTGSGEPIFALPAADPLGDTVLEILRIGEDANLAAFRERGERFDGRAHFHAVVGGREFAAGNFVDARAATHHRAPAAEAGIAFATAVGVDDDGFHMD